MDRREREGMEELYTEVGRPVPTDIGRMARAVALVRVGLLLTLVAVVFYLCLAAFILLPILLWVETHHR